MLQCNQTAFQCMNANLSAYVLALCVWLHSALQMETERGKRQLCACIFSSWSTHHQCSPHTFSKWTNLRKSHWLFVIKKTSSSSSCGCPVGFQHSWVSGSALYIQTLHCVCYLLYYKDRFPQLLGLGLEAT